jgi:hypothetical protein
LPTTAKGFPEGAGPKAGRSLLLEAFIVRFQARFRQATGSLEILVFQMLLEGKTEHALPGTGPWGEAETGVQRGIGDPRPPTPLGNEARATTSPPQITTARLRGRHRPSRFTTGTGPHPSTDRRTSQSRSTLCGQNRTSIRGVVWREERFRSLGDGRDRHDGGPSRLGTSGAGRSVRRASGHRSGSRVR